MSDPYVGEIRLFAGNYAPDNWMVCNGSLLNISQYQALYALLGTTYGGDGRTTFGIPDLQGRLPIHKGTNVPSGGTYLTYPIGAKGGTEKVTLTTDQMPAHNHAAYGQSVLGTQPTPGGNVWAEPKDTVAVPNKDVLQYNKLIGTVALKTMDPDNIQAVGGSQAHNNMMPSIAMNYIICLNGIFPDRP